MKVTEKSHYMVCDACGEEIKKSDARVTMHVPGSVKLKLKPITYDYHAKCVAMAFPALEALKEAPKAAPINVTFSDLVAQYTPFHVEKGSRPPGAFFFPEMTHTP